MDKSLTGFQQKKKKKLGSSHLARGPLAAETFCVAIPLAEIKTKSPQTV